MRKKLLILTFVIIHCLLVRPTYAIDWQETAFVMLHGADYRLGETSRTISALEYANGWKYGDNFVLVEMTNSTDMYSELSPRLSLGKMTDRDFSYGFIKDVLFTSTLELIENGPTTILFGGAIDLKFDGFTNFQVNTYIRDNTSLKGYTWQITMVVQRPFEINGHRFLTEGTMDFAGEESTSAQNFLIGPRLMLDVGNYWNNPGHVYMGTRYKYWDNKVGTDGVTEAMYQGILKVVF